MCAVEVLKLIKLHAFFRFARFIFHLDYNKMYSAILSNKFYDFKLR